MGNREAVEPLIQALLKDTDPVQVKAAESLGYLRDERAVEPLIQALKDEKRYHSVRWKAARALGEIGDKRAIEPLI
jgi:HEAT repeat protein